MRVHLVGGRFLVTTTINDTTLSTTMTTETSKTHKWTHCEIIPAITGMQVAVNLLLNEIRQVYKICANGHVAGLFLRDNSTCFLATQNVTFET